MKRVFLFLTVFLLILVSCSTKSVKQAEPEVEEVEATVVETSVPEIVVVTPESEQESQPEPADPEEETSASEEQAEDTEILPEEEVVIVETPVDAEQAAEVIEEIVEALMEEDWSKAITASAPVDDKPSVHEPEIAQAVSSEQPETTETVPVSSDSSLSAADATSSDEKKQAEKSDGLINRIGNFIVRQKLLSMGILIFCIGVIYLITALIISSRPKKYRRKISSAEAEEDTAETDAEPESGEGKTESSKPSSKADFSSQQEDDDAFLRSLLGEDKK